MRAEGQRLARMAGPLVIGQFAVMGMGVTDVIIAGHAGTDDLAAVTIGYYVWDLGMLLVFGILLANSALIGHRYGGGDHEGVRRQFQQCLWLSLPLALFSGLLIWLAILLLPRLDLTPEVARIAAGYLYPTIGSAMLIPVALTFRTTAEGLGLTRPVMWLMLGAFLINIPMNYVLVHGLFGLPRLGGAGCGWATLIAFLLLMIAWTLYSIRSRALAAFGLWRSFERPQPRLMVATLSLGLPIGLSLLAVGGFFAVVPLVMSRLGTEAIAGHAVAMTFDSLMLTIPLGVGQAMSVRVAHEMGGRYPQAARAVCITGMQLLIGIALLQAALIISFREPIAGLFTADPAVRELGTVLLVYAAAYRVFDSVQIGAGMALRGYRDTRVSSAIDVFAYWMFGLPLCYALGFGSRWQEAMGVEGFWLGMVIAIGAAALAISARLAWRSARELRVAEQPAPAGEQA